MRVLRVIALGFLAIAVLLAVALAYVLLAGVTADLHRVKPLVVRAAKEALGREVEIESAFLIGSLRPLLEVRGFRIGNPPGWPEPDFVRLERARLRIDLWPTLTSRRIQVEELRAEGAEVLFERLADGRVNWHFEDRGRDVEPEPDAEPAAEPEQPWWEVLLEDYKIQGFELQELAVERLRVSSRNAVTGLDVSDELESLTGSVATDEPLTLEARANLLNEIVTLSVKGGPPVDLFSSENPWPLAITLEAARTTVELETVIDEPIPIPNPADDSEVPLLPPGRRIGRFDLDIRGERLDDLDVFAGVSLPPLGPYSFHGDVRAFEGRRFESDARVRVGGSDLDGTFAFHQRTKPPRLAIELTADQIQLDDFRTEGWSLTGEEAPPPQEETTPEPEAQQEVAEPADLEPDTPRAAILSVEGLAAADVRLSIDVKQVNSGKDRLGAGRLVAETKAGRFRLDPLELQVPGGKLRMTSDIAPAPEGVATELGIEVHDFDYGILARRIDPETKMRGLFAMEVELESRAADASRLMEHATGYFDFAVFPEEFEAGVFDLWALNLFTNVLPFLGSSEPSEVNCAIGLFDLNDGVLTERDLLVDVTRVRVTGDLEVDFREQTVRAELVPNPKQPQFFALKTPVRVNGHFDDFGVGVAPQDLVGTVIQFAVSPVTFLPRWIISLADSVNGADACLDVLEKRDQSKRRSEP